MKDNALYEIIRKNKVPRNRHILKDEIIELMGLRAYEKCPYQLLRIEFFDPIKKEILVFLTNHLKLGASTIYGPSILLGRHRTMLGKDTSRPIIML